VLVALLVPSIAQAGTVSVVKAPKGDFEFAGESKSVSYESGAGEANEVRARFTDTTAIVSDPAGVEPAIRRRGGHLSRPFRQASNYPSRREPIQM